MKTKVCTKCGEEKEATSEFFSKGKLYKDGFRSDCKICHSNIVKKNNNTDIRKKERKLYNSKYRPFYRLTRIQNDKLFKFKEVSATRMRAAFRQKGFIKGDLTESILGNYKDAFNHIDIQLNNGMTWKNHSDWHIDHIIPLSSAKTREELIKLCHYSNTQPLWAKDNIEKGDKVKYCK